MKSVLKKLLLVWIALAGSSCATRTFCARDAPRLSRPEVARDSKAGQAGIVGTYVSGEQANDGFEVANVTSITLQPICGMGLMRTVFTLGLIPTDLPHPVVIKVQGTFKGRRETRTYQVRLHSWTSVWHRLVPSTSDNRAIARGLLGAMRSSAPVAIQSP